MRFQKFYNKEVLSRIMSGADLQQLEVIYDNSRKAGPKASTRKSFRGEVLLRAVGPQVLQMLDIAYQQAKSPTVNNLPRSNGKEATMDLKDVEFYQSEEDIDEELDGEEDNRFSFEALMGRRSQPEMSVKAIHERWLTNTNGQDEQLIADFQYLLKIIANQQNSINKIKGVLSDLVSVL